MSSGSSVKKDECSTHRQNLQLCLSIASSILQQAGKHCISNVIKNKLIFEIVNIYL